MLGAGLAALGGILGAELLPIDAYYPLRYMVLFLIVVAVGGMGSITGSFVAALGAGHPGYRDALSGARIRHASSSTSR